MTTSHIFQSTLPHGERPIVTIEMVKQFSISIHAPAWGATANTTVLREVIQISIHAPAWGATASVGMKAHQIQISIHAPAWGATETLKVAAACHRISIHAPAWGATSPAFTSAPASTYFNPRSRMGSDRLHSDRLLLRIISIHAPRMGSDQVLCLCGAVRDISIHAPRMGSDLHSVPLVVDLMNFNPRSPHGERPRIRETGGLS